MILLRPQYTFVNKPSLSYPDLSVPPIGTLTNIKSIHLNVELLLAEFVDLFVFVCLFLYS